MDSFDHQQCQNFNFQPSIQIEVEIQTQNDSQNVFGVNFKENMFSEPCILNTGFMQELRQDQKLIKLNEQCQSFNLTQASTSIKPNQFPPCRCHRIKCLKKYCECFRNGRKCTSKCICVNCCNQPIVTKMKVNVEQFWQVSYMFRKN